jgi:hypothetical protein
MSDKKVYCKNCVRFYITGVNQCEIPSCGMEKFNDDTELINFLIATGEINLDGVNFINNHLLPYIHYSDKNKTLIFGKPSKLNNKNDCYFYKDFKSEKNIFKRIWNWMERQ